MTEYYYSSNINSFPTTKKESVNKLLTENSLTRLINRLLDVDSFIISDGLAKKQNGVISEIIGNGGKHLKINADLDLTEIDFRNGLLEFVIRGYYFSTNLEDLLSLVHWDSYILSYTGEDAVGLYARIFIDNSNPNYPELIGQTAYENETQDYAVQFFISTVGGEPSPYHPIIGNEQTQQIDEGLGTDYLYYDLLLLKYIPNNYYDKTIKPNSTYLPFESLNKFDSHSQSIIDGGILKLYS